MRGLQILQLASTYCLGWETRLLEFGEWPYLRRNADVRFWRTKRYPQLYYEWYDHHGRFHGNMMSYSHSVANDQAAESKKSRRRSQLLHVSIDLVAPSFVRKIFCCFNLPQGSLNLRIGRWVEIASSTSLVAFQGRIALSKKCELSGLLCQTVP